MRKNKKNNEDYEDTGFNVDEFLTNFRRQGARETKTLTYMRGRTFTDSLVIVDEAKRLPLILPNSC